MIIEVTQTTFAGAVALFEAFVMEQTVSESQREGLDKKKKNNNNKNDEC